jgi:sugar diacid utilization regulator
LDDPASVEVLCDATVAAQTRLTVARRLGIAENAQVRAVALAGAAVRIESADGTGWPHRARSDESRAGLGPVGEVLALPASWVAARRALRFTAAGTEHDPGPRVVAAESLGGLAVLADVIGPDTEPIADALAIERARTDASWVLATLVAVANSPSLRTAATALLVHHSTLQERLGHVEHVLGWSIRDPQGRLRLQLAIAIWRLHRQP